MDIIDILKNEGAKVGQNEQGSKMYLFFWWVQRIVLG